MLAARFRFHGHGSLKFLHKNALVARSRYFTVKVVTNPHRKHSRFAVIVSKKVHKAAVGRNRIRRRVYESIRAVQPQFESTIDLAVIVTSGEALMAPYEELNQTLLGQLKELGLYHE
ncbi:MAG: ribonuclease P protein component [Candidatus Saccharimonas sp.]